MLISCSLALYFCIHHQRKKNYKQLKHTNYFIICELQKCKIMYEFPDYLQIICKNKLYLYSILLPFPSPL